MGAYVMHRVIQMLIAVFGISVIVFIITNMIGDPVNVLLPPEKIRRSIGGIVVHNHKARGPQRPVMIKEPRQPQHLVPQHGENERTIRTAPVTRNWMQIHAGFPA